MTLFEHLAELRTRLIICIVAVSIGVVLGFVLYPWIFDFLLHPYKEVVAADPASSATNGKLLQIDPLEGFGIRMKTSTYAGIALAMPVLLWQIWRFVTPGPLPARAPLRPAVRVQRPGPVRDGRRRSRTTRCPGRCSSSSTSAATSWSPPSPPGKYFQLIIYMMLAFGVGFEFPIILIFLQMVGIIDTALLRRVRRYAIVGICILVAVITPSR